MWTGTHNDTVVAISSVTILVTVRLGLRRPPFTGDSGSSQTDNYVPGFSRKEPRNTFAQRIKAPSNRPPTPV